MWRGFLVLSSVVPLLPHAAYMEPTYHDGDKVFVEKCDAVDIGEVGIFVVNGDVYVKELGNSCLISHNEKYKPIRIEENDSVYCCGRVIGIVE